MGWFDKAKRFIGLAVDKVESLVQRIKGVVDQSELIADVAANALLRLGDKAQDWTADQVVRYLVPIATACAAAQQNSLVVAAVGRDRLRAVQDTTQMLIAGVRRADETYDQTWARVRPFIESFRLEGKSRGTLGFELDLSIPPAGAPGGDLASLMPAMA